MTNVNQGYVNHENIVPSSVYVYYNLTILLNCIFYIIIFNILSKIISILSFK